jgi:hypothetical protein
MKADCVPSCVFPISTCPVIACSIEECYKTWWGKAATLHWTDWLCRKGLRWGTTSQLVPLPGHLEPQLGRHKWPGAGTMRSL